MDDKLIVCFIGVPCTGKGTLVRTIQEKILESMPVAMVSTGQIVSELLTEQDKVLMKQGGLFPREAELRDALYQSINDIWAFGATTILLDGFPRFDDQLVWLRQTCYDATIQVIQILANDDSELIRRASVRNRDEFDQPNNVVKRISEQRKLLSGVESLINKYAISYSSIININVKQSADLIIDRINWPKFKGK
jgi:adenylate kinase family enzyme